MYLLILIIFFLSPSIEENDWKFEKEKNGIKVYTKKSESSALKDSRVIGEIKADPETVASVLMDINTYPEWVPSCIYAEFLKGEGSSEIIYYAEYKAPWPVPNRDMIVKATKKVQENGNIYIDMIGIADYIEEKNKKVRIPEFKGYWLLERTEMNTTIATNEFHTDPGGNIPAWLANMTAVDNPLKTLKGLRERISNAQ